MTAFDVIVIGGGPGGYTAAVRSSQLGLKTALVEKERMGGTCLNWGCIPTKALLRNAEILYQISKARTFGFSFNNLEVNYEEAYKRSRSVVSRQTKRVESLMRQNKITVFNDEAVLESHDKVVLKSSGESLTGKNIIIATGASAITLPGLAFDETTVLNYRLALSLTKLPSSIVVVGAGPIGMEFATIWNRYGVNVTVVEMMDQVLPLEDAEVSAEVQKQIKRHGIEAKTGTKVGSVERTPQGLEISIEKGDQKEILSAEAMLVSIGFAPNLESLGVDKLGISMERGRIVVDDQMRTNLKNIFAVGDVNGKLGLAHVASAQAMIAAETIAGKETTPLVYTNIPRCVFTHPEVSSIGSTQQQAEEAGYEAIVAQCPLVGNGKAVALGENIGFIKIVADNKSRKVLGVHAVGDHVTEVVAGVSGMLIMGATIDDLSASVYPHPTISEAVMEAAHKLCGHAIHI